MGSQITASGTEGEQVVSCATRERSRRHAALTTRKEIDNHQEERALKHPGVRLGREIVERDDEDCKQRKNGASAPDREENGVNATERTEQRLADTPYHHSVSDVRNGETTREVDLVDREERDDEVGGRLKENETGVARREGRIRNERDDSRETRVKERTCMLPAENVIQAVVEKYLRVEGSEAVSGRGRQEERRAAADSRDEHPNEARVLLSGGFSGPNVNRAREWDCRADLS